MPQRPTTTHTRNKQTKNTHLGPVGNAILDVGGPDNVSVGDGDHGRAGDLPALPDVGVDRLLVGGSRDGPLDRRVEDHNVGVGPDRDHPLLRVHVEDARRVGREHRRKLVGRQLACGRGGGGCGWTINESPTINKLGHNGISRLPSEKIATWAAVRARGTSKQ